MALADSSALEARLGRLMTPAEEARADALLADASALVISYTRQEFTAVTDDVMTLRADYGSIRLPQLPVIDVTSVTATGLFGVPDIAVVGWTWDGLDSILVGLWAEVVINLPEIYAEQANQAPPLYRVVHSHGYATIPADVVSVVCAMALRCITSPTMVSGLVQEVIGPYSYRLDKDTSGSVVRLSDEERKVLDRYRRTTAMLRL
jgi:hypothetical protein